MGGRPASPSMRPALTIRFTSPEELLGAVLALAEDAAGNYEGFLARLGQRPGREEGEH